MKPLPTNQSQSGRQLSRQLWGNVAIKEAAQWQHASWVLPALGVEPGTQSASGITSREKASAGAKALGPRELCVLWPRLAFSCSHPPPHGPTCWCWDSAFPIGATGVDSLVDSALDVLLTVTERKE